MNDILKRKLSIKDRQVLEIPKNIKRCTKCVCPNTRPRITFNKKGICSACLYKEQQLKVNWDNRRKELKELCDKYRSNDGSPDVVVPCSGGKDSSMIAHVLKYEFDMNPLCVTFSPPVYTQIGFQNLRSFIDAGFNHVLISPPGDINKALTRLGFEIYGDHNEIFDNGQMSAPFRVALREGIKLVMYGENGEAEYGGTTEYADLPGPPWEAFAKTYYSDSLLNIYNIAVDLEYLDPKKYKFGSLKVYDMPPIEELERSGITMRWMGYYQFWDPQEHYYYATENTGFKPNPEGRLEGTYSKYAQLDDATDSFLYYMMFIKYGFGRATSDAAHEIRDGHITREEGLSLCKQYDGEFPSKSYELFKNYIGISDEEFNLFVNKYRSPYVWNKLSDSKWELKFKDELYS